MKFANKFTFVTVALIGLGLVAAHAEDLSTTDGMTYTNITKKRVDPDGLYIEYTPEGGGMGVAKVKFGRLTKAQRTHYGYDYARARDYLDQYEAGMVAWQADMDRRDKAEKDARAKMYELQVQSAQEQAARNQALLTAPPPVQSDPNPRGNAGKDFGTSTLTIATDQNTHAVAPPLGMQTVSFGPAYQNNLAAARLH